jgi:predicted Rossmann-fold nucleotide-binding protein
MNIAVVGSRNRFDKEYIHKVLDDFVRRGDVIVTGGATGVDTIALDYAVNKVIEIHEHFPSPPDYHSRNVKIATECEVMLAFPGKQSRGTWDTVNVARKLGRRVIVFEVK